ncbi:MAG: hypothetical protein M1378_01980 [Bacteroidetes bacterium]|nr:hypothetical protein [Bacteroidota bacterium]
MIDKIIAVVSEAFRAESGEIPVMCTLTVGISNAHDENDNVSSKKIAGLKLTS